MSGEVGLGERLHLGGLHRGRQTLGVQLAVAGQPDRQRLAGTGGVPQHEEYVLQGVRTAPGAVITGERRVEMVHEGLDGRCARRVLDV